MLDHESGISWQENVAFFLYLFPEKTGMLSPAERWQLWDSKKRLAFQREIFFSSASFSPNSCGESSSFSSSKKPPPPLLFTQFFFFTFLSWDAKRPCLPLQCRRIFFLLKKNVGKTVWFTFFYESLLSSLRFVPASIWSYPGSNNSKEEQNLLSSLLLLGTLLWVALGVKKELQSSFFPLPFFAALRGHHKP